MRQKTIIILITVLLAACGPAKHLRTPEPDPDSFAIDQTIAALRSGETSFDFFSARYSGTANFEGIDYTVSGNLRMINDSAIFISFAPVLGIEIGRLLVTPDSIKMINRLDNSYFVGDIQVLSNLLNTYVDFFMLQALLVGNDFSHFTNNDLRISNDKGRILLHSGDRKPHSKSNINVSFQHNLWLNDENHRIEESLLYEPLTRRSLRAVYHHNTFIDNQWIPRELSMFFTEPGARASISFRYSRITIDQPQTITFNIPGNYSPVNFILSQ